MHAVPASLKGKYVIRFTVTSQRTTVQDVARDWELISDTATELEGGEVEHTPKRIPLKRKQHKGRVCKSSEFRTRYLDWLTLSNRNQGAEPTIRHQPTDVSHWNKQRRDTQNCQRKFRSPFWDRWNGPRVFQATTRLGYRCRQRNRYEQNIFSKFQWIKNFAETQTNLNQIRQGKD